MMDDRPAGGPAEPTTTVTGGNKPLHRFLRGEPKCIGIVLMIMGICLFMFGLTIKTDSNPSADALCPFWLGILFIICGLLYVLSERNPTKKIITASFAFSIVSTIGVIVACISLIRGGVESENHYFFHHHQENYTEDIYEQLHYLSLDAMERVFLAHSLIGGVLIITMTFFARAALRSSGTQAVVVMRNLPSVE